MESELKRDYRDVKELVTDALHAAFAVGTGLFIYLPSLLSLEVMFFQYLLLIGLGGIGVRFLFMWIAPFLAKHSVTVAFIINALLLFCQAAFEFILAIIAVIGDAFNAVDDLLSLGLPHVPDLGKDVDFSHLYSIPKSAVHDALTYVVETCGPYDEAWKVIFDAIKQFTHAQACATVRFFWPVKVLRNFFQFWLEAFYDGSANPVDTHDNPGNCEASLENDYQISITCSSLGFGYVVVEVFIPLLLTIIVVIALASGLRRVLVLLYNIIKIGLEDLWRFFKKVVEPLIDRLLID